MQSRSGALFARLIVGVIHAVWHIPVWFIPGAGYDGQPFGVFILFTISLSILFAWIYDNTGGSVWLIGLAHAAINTFPSVWGAALQALPAAQRGLNPIVYLTLALVPLALLVIVLTKPRTFRG